MLAFGREAFESRYNKPLYACVPKCALRDLSTGGTIPGRTAEFSPAQDFQAIQMP